MTLVSRARSTFACPRRLLLGLSAFSLLLFFGCSTYRVPGERADLAAFASGDIADAFAVQPSNPWPANIAAIRLQGGNYSNFYMRRTNGVYGDGNYSVVTVREVDEESALGRLLELPAVEGITGVNRMLLPPRIDTDRELRLAAAKLRADLLFLYTFDTKFYESDASRPLTVISLGLLPTRGIRTVTTASALLVDTRTGFIYSTYEVTKERHSGAATSWNTEEIADKHRQAAEKEAFADLVDEVVKGWPALVKAHQSTDPAPLPPLGPNSVTQR